jgi:hypothetical protein
LFKQSLVSNSVAQFQDARPQHPHLLGPTLQMRHPYTQAVYISCTSGLWTKSLSRRPRTFFNTARCIGPLRTASQQITSIQVRHQQTQTPTRPQPLQDLAFWKCRHTWRRAMVNTTRCLIGCSLGDLSTMYYLMTYHPAMNAVTSMGLSSESETTRKIETFFRALEVG